MSLIPVRRRIFLFLSFVLLFGFACSVFAPEEAPTTIPVSPMDPATAAPAVTPVPPADKPAPADPTQLPVLPAVDQPVFAVFQEQAVQVVPAVSHEPIAPDLSNVQVSQVLSVAILERLARDGFVVSPGVEKEFFTVYEKARYNNEPIFVTSDSLLHVYHLLFGKVLRSAEMEYFIPLLQKLNAAALAQTDAQYQTLTGTD